jgi:hypothetical protein
MVAWDAPQPLIGRLLLMEVASDLWAFDPDCVHPSRQFYLVLWFMTRTRIQIARSNRRASIKPTNCHRAFIFSS